MDDELRAAERAAKEGDPDARRRVRAMRERTRTAPYLEDDGLVYVRDDDALDKAVKAGRRATLRLDLGDLVIVEEKRGQKSFDPLVAPGRWLGLVVGTVAHHGPDQDWKDTWLATAVLVDSLGGKLVKDYEPLERSPILVTQPVVVVRRLGAQP